jgi:hypothetical protein
MRKKPILLDKGMLGGSTETVPAPVSTPAQEASPAPRRTPKDYGEPLNFRVPPEFSQKFRLVAVRKRLSCPRFSWTSICPTGGRYGEIQHEQNHTQRCG